MLPIYDVSEFLEYKWEALGSKEKVWVKPPRGHELPHRPHLFKIGRPGTGENWAEVAAYLIASKLELPCAKYYFANRAGNIGVISEQFYPNNARFLPSNILLSKIMDDYDGSKKYKQIDYELRKILFIAPRLSRNGPIDSLFTDPLNAFIGYLIFDALIGNTDRHHENWGIVLQRGKISLAPTFDHASSLGRDETEERRLQRLETRDQRATVEAYAERARTAFFDPQGQGRTLTMREMLIALTAEHPEFTRFWAERAVSLPPEFFSEVFEQMPPDCVTENAAPFAKRLLAHNQRVIMEIALGR